MEHDLQKKQELELWNMVLSGKPGQGAKTPSRTPQRMKQEVPNRNYQTISRSKKTAQAVRRKKARKRRIRFYRLMAIICLLRKFLLLPTTPKKRFCQTSTKEKRCNLQKITTLLKPYSVVRWTFIRPLFRLS